VTLLQEIQQQRDVIHAMAQRYGIENVRIFGSVARGEEREDSDIDVLVSLRVPTQGWACFDFQFEMEKMFGRKVDMVFERGLFHAIKDDILREAKPL
jgi:uncharacterized protein